MKDNEPAIIHFPTLTKENLDQTLYEVARRCQQKRNRLRKQAIAQADREQLLLFPKTPKKE